VQNVANGNEATALDQASTNAKKLVDALGLAAEKVGTLVCTTYYKILYYFDDLLYI